MFLRDLWDVSFNNDLIEVSQGHLMPAAWALGSVYTQIHIFQILPNFLRFFKSFDNSWGNSYIKFATLDIKFRFTCGVNRTCANIF